VGASFRLRLASSDDLSSVLDLIDGAADWLRSRGTNQWQRPWPSREERDRRVHDSLLSGETWLLWDGDTPLATVTVSPTPDDLLWTPRECTEPAAYLHRLVVDRAHAGHGIGAHLLDWAGERARREYGARWIRIDVWADNYALHRYYLRQGFRPVRRSARVPGYPAGALFQKDVRRVRLSRHVPFEVEPAPGNGGRPTTGVGVNPASHPPAPCDGRLDGTTPSGNRAARPVRESGPVPARLSRTCGRTRRLPRP
jgi:GNAT superfamily N-acetyltransferase